LGWESGITLGLADRQRIDDDNVADPIDGFNRD
jgi:hypothetical protein